MSDPNAPAVPSGLLLIDKPKGITSFDIIRQLRRQTSIRKIGHCGTLDPMATGLMLMVVGSATKQAMRLTKLDKAYEATIRLGATSTTQDAEGEISTLTVAAAPSGSDVRTVLRRYVGEITQTPSMYSAIKIDGQEAYKRARNGEAVVMPSRTVTVSNIELISYEYPDIVIRADVSSGTYIRSLAADIGAELVGGGYLTALRRTKVGAYQLSQAHSLDDISADTIKPKLSIIDPL